MQKDAVQLIRKRYRRDAVAARGAAGDALHIGVARLGDSGGNIEVGVVQAAAAVGNLLAHGRRPAGRIASPVFRVSQQGERLGKRDGRRKVVVFLQQRRKLGHFRFGLVGKTPAARRRRRRVRQSKKRGAQSIHAGFTRGDDRAHRNPQRLFQRLRVHFHALLRGGVAHRQHHQHRQTQIKKLRGQVQVTL